jgi:hypothetical protein
LRRESSNSARSLSATLRAAVETSPIREAIDRPILRAAIRVPIATPATINATEMATTSDQENPAESSDVRRVHTRMAPTATVTAMIGATNMTRRAEMLRRFSNLVSVASLAVIAVDVTAGAAEFLGTTSAKIDG